MDRVIIDNMLTSIHLWKNTFIKVYLARGYHSIYMDDNYEPYYPLKWMLPKKHTNKSCKILLLNKQNVVAQLLVAAPFDAQALISEFNRKYPWSIGFCVIHLTYFFFAKLWVDNTPINIPT